MPDAAEASSEPAAALELVDDLEAGDLPDKRQTGRGQRGRRSGHQAAARRVYLASVRRGKPLTGEQLGERYGMSERWGRMRIEEARQSSDLPHVGVRHGLLRALRLLQWQHTAKKLARHRHALNLPAWNNSAKIPLLE